MSSSFPVTLDTFENPSSTNKLNGGSNPLLAHHTQHTNINDTASAIEAKLGVNFSNNPLSIDYILQVVEMTWMNHSLGKYKEISYVSNVFPETITWYTDSFKTIKLLEKTFMYGPANKKFVTEVTWKLYDGTIFNVLKRTITDTITRSGPVETSRIRTII